MRSTILAIGVWALVAAAVPARGDVVYLESGGMVVGEAELFSARNANPNENAWVIRPVENSGTTSQEGGPIVSNFRGDGYMQTLPDDDPTGGGGNLVLPEITYSMLIGTPGQYQLYVRWDGNSTSGGTGGGSDSLFADIVELKDGAGGTIPDWYELTQGVNGDFANPSTWDGLGGFEQNAAGASNDPIVWDILNPGLYTLRFTQREDGVAVDAWTFQLSSLAAPSGAGPETSALLAVPEPATLGLAGLGLLAFCLYRWRRRGG